MTETRRKTIDLIIALLADCAADGSLPPGTRERMVIMSGRIATEIECIEGVAEALEELQKLQARQGAAPTVADASAERKHVERAPSRCGGFYWHHKWAGGLQCRRCGARRASFAPHAEVFFRIPFLPT